MVNSASVHCLQTHKFHFSATFSLKMGLTVLFTHLKNILLQYFQFQFLISTKINSIQTDPLLTLYSVPKLSRPHGNWQTWEPRFGSPYKLINKLKNYVRIVMSIFPKRLRLIIEQNIFWNHNNLSYYLGLSRTTNITEILVNSWSLWLSFVNFIGVAASAKSFFGGFLCLFIDTLCLSLSQ